MSIIKGSLTEYARTTPQDSKFVENFRDTAKETLDTTLDVLKRPGTDAEGAIQRLKDLRDACYATMATTKSIQVSNDASTEALVQALNDGGDGIRHESQIELLHNVKPHHVPLPHGVEYNGWHRDFVAEYIRDGKITRSPETAVIKTATVSGMTDVNKFAQDLTSLMSYLTATSIPGPVGSSALLAQDQRSQGILDGRGDFSMSDGNGSGHSEIHGRSESSSQPVLMRMVELVDDLQVRLNGAHLEKSPTSTVVAEHTEQLMKTTAIRHRNLLASVWVESKGSMSTFPGDPRVLARVEHQPEHLSIPMKAADVHGDGYFG